MSNPVRIVKADPEWPQIFEAERLKLASACGDRIEGIEHIGSTAVPGLASKPVVDILITVREMALLSTLGETQASIRKPEDITPGGNERHVELVAGIKQLGYLYFGEYGIPRRLFFKRASEPVGFHIHIVREGSVLHVEHLLFRDYLRAHPDIATRYANLKKTLASQHQRDRNAYGNAKAPFIAQVLRAARGS